MGHQFEKDYVVGDKVGERTEIMGTQTGGSRLVTALEQVGGQTLNYTEKSVCVQGLGIFHNSYFPPCIVIISLFSV